MNYTKQDLQLDNPIEFWLNFPNEERVFWVDRQSDRIVVGAKRLATVQDDEDRKQYAYVFYGGTFFDHSKDPKWANMGHEMIAFTHYYIVENGQSFYLYAGEPQAIQRFNVPRVEHVYRETSDDKADWNQLMRAIDASIKNGTVTKVVSSREVEYTSDSDFNVPSILDNLVEHNPNCFIFAYEKEGRTFLGASPEILVRHRGNQILSYALAGTAPKLGPTAWTKEQLLKDKKNRFEHNIVRDRIVEIMKTVTPHIEIGETEIMELSRLYHLRTIITATDSTKSLVEWGQLLHPTPALGGEPRTTALALLQQYETHERGMYAAPFGFMKDMGDGILVVAIRSALVISNTLYAYAGCGVVDGSDSDAEYEETNQKMRTILDAL
ncbi:isochorismate synthase [Veillonella caviae]|uniref:isochorismate synthase n=1 Tax=Veillonella caviae TaxID=248316 RepID=UPI0023A8AA0B|nr:isochorismate synthase [Veillonella caviae]MCI5709000.1 isochorismate synthase [Veillonella caviae]MDD7291119.1 isochorismate synthase [Veillonella caviae]MDY5714923.1 isochorismate synthase [Veillonella caviae]MDY5788148.1 isochorismate synthase [Veillonella caviae]